MVHMQSGAVDGWGRVAPCLLVSGQSMCSRRSMLMRWQCCMTSTALQTPDPTGPDRTGPDQAAAAAAAAAGARCLLSRPHPPDCLPSVLASRTADLPACLPQWRRFSTALWKSL